MERDNGQETKDAAGAEEVEDFIKEAAPTYSHPLQHGYISLHVAWQNYAILQDCICVLKGEF
jgi:hypothetical protein